MPGQMIDIGQIFWTEQEKNSGATTPIRDPVAKYYKAKRHCSTGVKNRTVTITINTTQQYKDSGKVAREQQVHKSQAQFR